jgi:hypothetical protein
MTMPGFTAQAALYRTSEHYYHTIGTLTQAVDTIHPAQLGEPCSVCCDRCFQRCFEGCLTLTCLRRCFRSCNFLCGGCCPVV